MGIPEYLDWRGDIPFSVAPVNPVDEYIICKTGMPDLAGLVPENGDYISVGRAVEGYRAAGRAMDLGLISSTLVVPCFLRLPETVRFRDLMLTGYRDETIPENNKQFSALTVRLPGGVHYVTFRGTDDTLVGWKENFLMTVMESVPAQREALRYLCRAAETYPGELVVAGHSKGGNLAVFAASRAPEEIQRRISRVICFDSPGFWQDFYQEEGYRRIRDRICRILPQKAVIGNLLYQDGAASIVRSSVFTASSHDGFRWDTAPDGFVPCPEFTPSALAFDSAMKEVLVSLTREEREAAIEEFFGTLASGGCRTLTDLSGSDFRRIVQMLRTLGSTPEVRKLFAEMAENLARDYLAERGKTLPQLTGRFRREKKGE